MHVDSDKLALEKMTTIRTNNTTSYLRAILQQ